MPPSKVVLFVEDDACSMRLCRAALEDAGWRVAAASSTSEALATLAAGRVALAVLDAGIDRKALAGLCGSLRRDDARILLLIPPRFPAEALAELQRASDACLFKPFSLEELQQRAAELMQLRQAPATQYGPEPGADTRASHSLREVSHDLCGREVGGCRLERILGRGSMGTVYFGRHLLLDVPVAVKVFSEATAEWSAEELKRFLRGARAAARVEHPNVVAILNAGCDKETYFLVQRYVEGETLKSRIEKLGRLPAETVIRLLRDVASGLAAAHRLDIVHRDVKPGNIILTPPGDAVLTDFGLARGAGQGDVSSRSDLVGTLYYMSPEQCRGGALDGRSDLYSLGASAYHALTGRPPFQGDSPVAVVRGHMESAPVPPSRLEPELPRALCNMVMRLLAKSAADRYATAEDLIEALGRMAPPSPPKPRTEAARG